MHLLDLSEYCLLREPDINWVSTLLPDDGRATVITDASLSFLSFLQRLALDISSERAHQKVIESVGLKVMTQTGIEVVLLQPYSFPMDWAFFDSLVGFSDFAIKRFNLFVKLISDEIGVGSGISHSNYMMCFSDLTNPIQLARYFYNVTGYQGNIRTYLSKVEDHSNIIDGMELDIDSLTPADVNILLFAEILRRKYLMPGMKNFRDFHRPLLDLWEMKKEYDFGIYLHARDKGQLIEISECYTKSIVLTDRFKGVLLNPKADFSGAGKALDILSKAGLPALNREQVGV